jgi:hypothetical protein
MRKKLSVSHRDGFGAACGRDGQQTGRREAQNTGNFHRARIGFDHARGGSRQGADRDATAGCQQIHAPVGLAFPQISRHFS